MTSWYTLLREAVKENGDRFNTLSCTLSRKDMKEEFDNGFGRENGRPFTAWSTNWVYFPITYDGAESVGSVPRNPCKIVTHHVGGS